MAMVPAPHPLIVPVKTSVLFAYNEPSASWTAEPVCVVVPATAPEEEPLSENGITHDVRGLQTGAPTTGGSCTYSQMTVRVGGGGSVDDGSTTVVVDGSTAVVVVGDAAEFDVVD